MLHDAEAAHLFLELSAQLADGLAVLDEQERRESRGEWGRSAP